MSPRYWYRNYKYYTGRKKNIYRIDKNSPHCRPSSHNFRLLKMGKEFLAGINEHKFFRDSLNDMKVSSVTAKKGKKAFKRKLMDKQREINFKGLK